MMIWLKNYQVISMYFTKLSLSFWIFILLEVLGVSLKAIKIRLLHFQLEIDYEGKLNTTCPWAEWCELIRTWISLQYFISKARLFVVNKFSIINATSYK